MIWVKGDQGGETFQIGVKDLSGKEVKIESEVGVIVSSTAWSQLVVDLEDFAGVDLGSVENINLGFNKNHGAGKVCVDEITLS